MDTASVIKRARRGAGLSQAELARRAGMSQPAIARLERAGSNPRTATLAAVLQATGRRLTVAKAEPPVDLIQLDRHLAMTPADRLRTHHAAARNLSALRRTARRAGSG